MLICKTQQVNDKRGMQKIDLGRTGERVSERVAHFRADRRLTYLALSERLTAAGWAIPELGLRRIEAGARRVTVDDLMALAVALNVSPLELLLPPRWSSEPLPTGVPEDLTPAEAWAWAKEQTGLSTDTRLDFWVAESTRILDEMSAYEQMAESAKNHTVRDVARKNLERLEAEHGRVVERVDELNSRGGG